LGRGNECLEGSNESGGGSGGDCYGCHCESSQNSEEGCVQDAI
jgi:hypothetical protein